MNMNIKTTTSPRAQGSVLLIALILCAIMGITLASYLVMATTEEKTVRRSQVWNGCLAYGEAGVEDALAHLNSPSGFSGVLASDGWTLQADGSFSVTRNLDSGYYTVGISLPAGQFPVITSQGFAQLNLVSSTLGTPMFAAVWVPQSGPVYSSRKILVNTKLDALLSVAMAAKLNINLSGNNVSSDSFDSTDTNFSTNGLYDASRTKAGGDIVTDDTIINTFNVGNANIKGIIRTGPNGAPAIGPNASVGDSAWVTAGTKGIEPGHFFNDMNVDWPDVALPSATYLPPTVANTNINGVNYKYYLTSGNYQISDFTGSVYVDGNAVVYVPPAGTLKLSGQDQIYVAPNSLLHPTSMKLFVGTATASLGGQGVINATGNAINFIYYGLPSNTALNFSANAAFVGSIYCPNAAFTLGGGGNNNYDFVGASVSRTVKMNGNFNFHYDENLRRIGPGRGYVATSWKEL